MEDVTKNLIGKISSYNVLNYFLPGLIFCYLIERNTRFSFSVDSAWVNIFVYYFVGMIVSRMGSLIVEKFLESLKIGKGQDKVPFLNRVTYDEYMKASTENPFIETLSETNNLYRTLIMTFLLAAIIKLYDRFVYERVMKIWSEWDNLFFIVGCVAISVVFVFSYRKQTDYVQKRVKKQLDDDVNLHKGGN